MISGPECDDSARRCLQVLFLGWLGCHVCSVAETKRSKVRARMDTPEMPPKDAGQPRRLRSTAEAGRMIRPHRVQPDNGDICTPMCAKPRQ